MSMAGWIQCLVSLSDQIVEIFIRLRHYHDRIGPCSSAYPCIRPKRPSLSRGPKGSRSLTSVALSEKSR